jgi:hypothetical protein
MREIASGPRYFFWVADIERVIALFERIRPRYISARPRALEVTDTLSEHVDYVPGSASPPQAAPVLPDRTLRWTDRYIPSDGLTYTYTIKPNRLGRIETNLSATGVMTDSRGIAVRFVFEVPTVTVLEPTAAPTNTASPRPTDTPTVTAEATRQPAPALLPLVRSR